MDYIRLTIYPTESINNIVDLPDDTKGIDGKAIFFSTLTNQPYNVNISPFTDDKTFKTKTIASQLNDFKIYKNPDGNIYIKPNEIFNEFELPQGDYKIQIDFLNQLTKVSPPTSLSLSLPMPFWFEDFDYNGNGILNGTDAVGWTEVGRQDIADVLVNFIINEEPPPKYYEQQDGSGPDIEQNPLRGPEYLSKP